jgi:hypothetical protein
LARDCRHRRWRHRLIAKELVVHEVDFVVVEECRTLWEGETVVIQVHKALQFAALVVLRYETSIVAKS